MRKRLLKDIIIPKGMIFNKAPARTERYGEGHFDCVVGLSTNTSGHFEYYIGPDYPDETDEYFEDCN